MTVKKFLMHLGTSWRTPRERLERRVKFAVRTVSDAVKFAALGVWKSNHFIISSSLCSPPGISRKLIQQYSLHLVNRLLSSTRNPTALGRVFPDTGLILPIPHNRFAYHKLALAVAAQTRMSQPLQPNVPMQLHFIRQWLLAQLLTRLI